MTTESAREEAVNPLLGQLLRQRGIPARAERRSRGDTPDIRYELPTGELVLLECKWESGHADLIDQLDDRLTDFPDAIARVGVLYPDDFRHVDDIQEPVTFSSPRCASQQRLSLVAGGQQLEQCPCTILPHQAPVQMP